MKFAAIIEVNDDTLAFDMSTLEKLRLVKYEVDDPWLQEEVTYTGVLLSDLLEVAGAPGRGQGRIQVEGVEQVTPGIADPGATGQAVADVVFWVIGRRL